MQRFPTSVRHAAALGRPRARPTCRQPLVAALLTALAVPLAHSSATSGEVARPNAPAQTWIVQNCNDDGPGSLRDIVENPVKAKSGDRVDLSQLPTLCGMTQSTITLSGGEIAVAQDDLYLYGPTHGTVTISGNDASRVFHHTGMGTLSVNSLTVSHGYYHVAGPAYGGCIESVNGNVTLGHAIVEQCRVVSDMSFANGGGVSAYHGNVSLLASTVSGSYAQGGSDGWGGGVYSWGTVFAWYSSVSGNAAHDAAFDYGRGGGIAARAGITLIASTVDNNVSGYGAGLRTIGAATILDSTISGNTATHVGGGVWALHSDPFLIANSTIVMNHQATAALAAGGVYFKGSSASSTLTMQSSIIALNTATALNTPADLFLYTGSGVLAGTDNLVTASNVADPNVITLGGDPGIGPLQFNGGPTRTHQLLAGSPARSQGNAAGLPVLVTTDQRGLGYPRTTGAAASIDLGAVQFDTLFVDGLESPF